MPVPGTAQASSRTSRTDAHPTLAYHRLLKANMATGMASTGRATAAGILATASATAMSATAGGGGNYDFGESTQPLDSREAAVVALKAYVKRVRHVTKHKRLLLKPHFEGLDHRYDQTTGRQRKQVREAVKKCLLQMQYTVGHHRHATHHLQQRDGRARASIRARDGTLRPRVWVRTRGGYRRITGGRPFTHYVHPYFTRAVLSRAFLC